MTAYELLRQAIATGQRKQGERVLESELAGGLKMSGTPVREAIAPLEADGLATMNGPQGRVVTKLDYQSVLELYAVREALESMAAGLAARNASAMEIAALRETLEREGQILDDPGGSSITIGVFMRLSTIVPTTATF
jgi:DNA-binding GntR family transcriptional regulator